VDLVRDYALHLQLSEPPNPMSKLRDSRVWADYIRLRRKPTKECVQCHRIWPNDRAHFMTGSTGFITAHCTACGPKDLQGLTTGLITCPVCEEQARLVKDDGGPEPWSICRRCLMQVNMLTTAGAFRNLVEYVKWRNQW
jgi:hypothetical protein